MDFNNILIGSEDPKRLADYYTKLFGTPTWDDDGYVGWMIGSGAVTVGPHDQVHGRNPEPGRIIWNIETPDVKGEFERLKAAASESRPRAVHLRRCAGQLDRDPGRPG